MNHVPQFLIVFLAVISVAATVEWLWLKIRNTARWTTDPNRWDTPACVEIAYREHRLKRELSSEETKAVVEKWFKRFEWVRRTKPSIG